MEFLSHKGTITSGNVAKWAGGKGPEYNFWKRCQVGRWETKIRGAGASRIEMFGGIAPKSKQLRAGNNIAL